MPAWPATLPTRFMGRDYSETLPDNTLRSTVDVGPAKARPRTTANTAPLQGSMLMTPDQRSTLIAFYATVGGFTSFTMPHPAVDAAPIITVRCTAPPKFGDASPNYLVTLALEIMP